MDKHIPLTRGKYAVVNGCDVELVSKHKWQARPSKGNWYATTRIDGIEVFMHNLILGRVHGLEIDHIDQDGLNNTRQNLRYATRSQNRANVKIRKDNKSGYKGVCYNSKTGKWRAYIQKDRRWSQIGMFNTPIEAARAYNKKAKELFGEYAWQNPIH
jgi:hypothetical protein